LGLEQDLFNRVYYYLLDDGYIKSVHSDGISITHKAKREIGDGAYESTYNTFWRSPIPDITISDDIVYALDKIKAGPIRELRIAINNLNTDSKNKPAFISCLLAMATVLGDINTKEIRKLVTIEDIKGISLIQELFSVRGIEYDESDFVMLRKVIRLRSTILPVHSAETEFSQALRYLGIQYPVLNWAEAADNCLKHVLEALNNILEKLS
jgi:hypothetical protein